jgi:outer membrane protein assembly factor BamB
MKRALFVSLLFLLGMCLTAQAQNWPQWRGSNRDAKVTGFKAPAEWPKELAQKWKVSIGDGVSTPALVDDKLYVIGRIGDKEVVRALHAGDGTEIWKDEYDAEPPRGPAAAFSGPRSSPTVADGKVITLGVHGTLTCYDAASGAKLWRKDGFGGGVPRFAPASSPIVLDGLCIAQVGSDSDGGIVAYDLATGNEKWKWTGDGPAYASPALFSVNDAKAVVAVTSKNLVALNIADGKQLWKVAYTQGRYNATTPVVDGKLLIYAGPTKGMTAVALEKQGDELAKQEGGWKSEDNSLMYNTPVLRDSHLYGVTGLNAIFCLNATTGESAWSAPIAEPGASGSADAKKSDEAKAPEKGSDDGGKGPGGMRGGKGGRGGMRGGGGGGGYGSIVDAGAVLIALNPTGQLICFEPNPKEFKQLALYKVADGNTYAYPVISGNRIFIKNKDSLTLWMLD